MCIGTLSADECIKKVFKGAVVRNISHSRHTIQMVWASDFLRIDSSAIGVQKELQIIHLKSPKKFVKKVLAEHKAKPST